MATGVVVASMAFSFVYCGVKPPAPGPPVHTETAAPVRAAACCGYASQWWPPSGAPPTQVGTDPHAMHDSSIRPGVECRSSPRVAENYARGMATLTRSEAIARADLLRVDAYRIDLDLSDTNAGDRFESVTTVTFSCRRPGAGTFV